MLKTKFFLLGLILALSLGFYGAAPAYSAPQPTTLTLQNNNSTLNISKGSILIVRLDYTGGTGYIWRIAQNNANLLKPLGSPSFEIGKKHLGAKGFQIFKFKAQALGAVDLRLEYLRPWEKQTAPANTFKAAIKIIK
jgi:predicted secreted protein